jgi:ABC-type glycerol-3-phosphate transport system permease component
MMDTQEKKMTEERTFVAGQIYWSLSDKIARQIPMIILCILALFPTYFMVSASLKTREEYRANGIGLPNTLTLNNYQEITLTEDFFTWVRNSTLITIISAIVSVIISLLAAYAFSRLQFRGNYFLFNIITSLMIIPPIVMLIPLFILMARIGLINTYLGVIIIYAGTLLPFSIYLLSRFIDDVPSELLDSARVDGATEYQNILFIITPLTKPALITLFIVNALYVWNELLVALVFLQKEQLRTLMIGVTLFANYRQLDVPLIMAGLVLAVLPIVALYIVGQQFFIQGLTEGSMR